MKHTVTISYAVDGDTQQAVLVQDNAGSAQIDTAVASNAVNAEVDFSWIVAQGKSLYVSCDQAVTLKTNSSGSPTETVTLAAGVPRIWQPSSGLAAIFASDVSKLYVTNTGGTTAGTLRIRALSQPHP